MASSTGEPVHRRLFNFSFRSFRKHRRAKRARDNERGAREKHYPFALAVNKYPAVYIYICEVYEIIHI